MNCIFEIQENGEKPRKGEIWSIDGRILFQVRKTDTEKRFSLKISSPEIQFYSFSLTVSGWTGKKKPCDCEPPDETRPGAWCHKCENEGFIVSEKLYEFITVEVKF